MIVHDPNIREEETWKDFSEKGLCPGIDNLDRYREKLSKNYLRFGLEGPLLRNLQLDPEKLKAVHKNLFSEIYPFAGEFRKDHVFCRSRAGADPKDIKAELDLLQQQVAIMLQEAENTRAVVRIIAFQHARLTTIQAFADGNSRTSRAITDRFLGDVLGTRRRTEINRREYLQALESALGEENLAPLTNLLLKFHHRAPEKTNWIPAPFRTTNLPSGVDPVRALSQSFRQHPDILNDEVPLKAAFLKNHSWSDIKAAVGGKPTKAEDQCEKIWEAARGKVTEWKDVEALVTKIQAAIPFAKPLLGKAPDWTNIREMLRPPGMKPQPRQNADIELSIQ